MDAYPDRNVPYLRIYSEHRLPEEAAVDSVSRMQDIGESLSDRHMRGIAAIITYVVEIG